jgi:APA family basic amino acid/polyamine antiporter
MKKLILITILSVSLYSCGKKEDNATIESVIEAKNVSALQAKKSLIQADLAKIDAALATLDVKKEEALVSVITIKDTVFNHYLVIQGNVNTALNWTNSWKHEVMQSGFAVSMVYVAFAYTGWNAAAYVVDEIEDPSKNLPRALIGSTLFVAIVYILFQLVLMKNASVTQLQGKEEVTFIAFDNLLGSAGGKWVSIFIAIQLVATISSYLWVGPRVTWAMASENKLWKPLAKKNKHGIPVAAIWAHVTISILLTLTGSFERILLYAGFVLQLMGSLTVATSLFLPKNNTPTFKSPFKPVLQILFLLFNAWVLVFTLIDRPAESLIGLAVLGLGGIIYYFDKPSISVDEGS